MLPSPPHKQRGAAITGEYATRLREAAPSRYIYPRTIAGRQLDINVYSHRQALCQAAYGSRRLKNMHPKSESDICRVILFSKVYSEGTILAPLSSAIPNIRGVVPNCHP